MPPVGLVAPSSFFDPQMPVVPPVAPVVPAPGPVAPDYYYVEQYGAYEYWDWDTIPPAPSTPVVPSPRASAPWPAPLPPYYYTYSNGDDGTSSNTGAIVGGVFGALACMSILSAGAAFVIHRRRKQQRPAAGGADEEANDPKRKADLDGGDTTDNDDSSGVGGFLSPNLLPSFLPPPATLMTTMTDSHFSAHTIENLSEEEDEDGEERERMEIIEEQRDVVVVMETDNHYHPNDDQNINPLLPSSFPPPNILTQNTTTTNSEISNAYYYRTDTSALSTPTAPPLESVLITPTTTTTISSPSSSSAGAVAQRRRLFDQTPKRSLSGSGGGSGIPQYIEIDFQDLELHERLGEGSFGCVYRATYNLTSVAAKVLIDPSRGARRGAGADELAIIDEALLMEMEKEASLMASPALRHPNIIQLMGVCLYPPTIVTEYCERGSLTQVLSQAKSGHQPLSWRMRLNMALGAAKGMLHLHSRSPPVLHRDFKSPNLLVTDNLRVKVADFNLSKESSINNEGDGTGSLLANTNTKGGPENPRWLAPELLLPKEKATAASDVFAFGVVMWEILTCEVPWGAESPLQIGMNIMNGKRLPIPLEEEDICGLGSSRDDDHHGGGRQDGNDPQQQQLLPGYDRYVTLLEQCWAQDKKERPDFKHITMVLTLLCRAQDSPRGSLVGSTASSRAKEMASVTTRKNSSSPSSPLWRF